MNNELIKANYNGEEVVFKVENGISYVRVLEVAKFCGWEKIENKNGKEYKSIRMATVNKFLSELGFANEVSKEDFIPEYIMYPLIGKANNESATNFMLWVGQVLTEIRTTGKYDTIEHEIMKIEDEEERKLTLSVYKLEEALKVDKDEFTALRLENKRNQLENYKQSKKIVELENKVQKNDEKVNIISDKISKATVLREGDMSSEVIAKKLNIFSTTGKPHNRFADNMARVLGFYINPQGNIGYQDQWVSINLTSRGGVTIPVLKYSKEAFEEMEKYINENGLHIEQPPVYYKRNCKNGKIGEFNYAKLIFDEIEESIKVNKITYDLYINDSYED